MIAPPQFDVHNKVHSSLKLLYPNPREAMLNNFIGGNLSAPASTDAQAGVAKSTEVGISNSTLPSDETLGEIVIGQKSEAICKIDA